MRKLVLLVIILWGLSFKAAAQEPWPVVQNCMGDLTYPVVSNGNWDFPGVIISSVHPEGVRGIRADQNVEYFIALEADDAFPAVGEVSPDGYYFAYPIGHTTYNVNSGGDDILGVDYLRIVRTDGITDEVYRFEANTYVYTGAVRSFKLPSPVWYNTDLVYYESSSAYGGPIDLKAREVIPWDETQFSWNLTAVSPDESRAFTMPYEAPQELIDIETGETLPYSTTSPVYWFPDSSAFISSEESGILIVDRDGNLVENPYPVQTDDIALAPNGSAFAFWDANQSFYLADVEQEVIYDLCFQGLIPNTATEAAYYYPNLAWSPDSRSLAFSYDEYLVILDSTTFENQIIDHFSKQVMAWVPLQGQSVESATGGIRQPQATATPSPTATITPTIEPTMTFAPPTGTPEVATCQLEVLTGANLRSGPGTTFDHVGSAAEGFQLTADEWQFNETEYFRWWHLTTDEWIREDFTRESVECDFLPESETTP